jgi:hypothetical protein
LTVGAGRFDLEDLAGEHPSLEEAQRVVSFILNRGVLRLVESDRNKRARWVAVTLSDSGRRRGEFPGYTARQNR